ncbi:SNF2 family N-terminal domain-containing protein [Glomus cerebriforme]|uniref:SNF2 family N-terminal domain-containing protein n=1 Tax=Glomus cerebriforme TaxID=658196 RepID=A0A397TD02_9GLOM|nr:SNF2 family N-terminal domain-containing protein [Glomus cerebriforme]
MKVLGATEETNPSYANAKSYLRECELKAKAQLKLNEEQMSRIRNQKAAYARLVSEQQIPLHMQLGMLSKERAEKEKEELLPYKLTGTIIFKEDSIPNIPIPESVEKMQYEAEERENSLRARMQNRIRQLESLPSNLSNDPPALRSQVNVELRNKPGPKIKALIELKGLKLYKLQKRIRHDVLQYSKFRRPESIVPMFDRRRPVKQKIRTWAATQAAEKERVERSTRSQRLMRQDFLDNIIAHGDDMINRNKKKQSIRMKLGRAVMNYHAILQKEYQRKTDRYSKERLAALKNNDEEAYLKLIDEAKDTRITHLLRQTDVYLESLAKAVIAQQNEFQQLLPMDSTLKPGGNIIRPNDTIASVYNNKNYLNNVTTSSDNRIQTVNGTIETTSNIDTTRPSDNSMKISNLLINDTVPATINSEENAYILDHSDDVAETKDCNRPNDNIANGSNPSAAVEDEDNIIQTTDGKKIDYYAVAHRIQEEVQQPVMLEGGTLKEYQLKGLQWMVSLFNNRLNGILADEMGLGKTIQTISLITYLIERKQQHGPFLIIVPLSTLTNWNLEFDKWAPSVKKCIYKGPPPERKEIQKRYLRHGNYHVCLTTYDFIIKDKTVLSKPKWLYVIIDEGHRMKNTNSKLSMVLSNDYAFRYRLILTGTPLQNNLPELWSLLNFVLPKIFDSVKSFDEWFNTPFANTGGQDKIALNEEESLLIIRRLHKVLRPFLLRRLKKDVESELPDKIETVIKVKMSALQVKLYNQMKKHGALFVNKGEKGKTGIKGLNNTIMQLRKICNHPFVFEEVEKDTNLHNDNNLLYRVSGKFEFLDRVLPKFFQSKHRVLIFFQMTTIMTIMEDYLCWRGYHFLRLDGSTKADDRSAKLKEFNDPNSPYFIFLLSTRAGGLGLNLQTADTVIIFDSDWNPHQDLQAQDRAHRIGQTNEVRILRLICQKSIEETILARAQYKLDIDGKVIQAGKFDQKSTAEEREAFLRSLLETGDAEINDPEDEEREVLEDDEINLLISRNEEELELFKKIDIDRQKREEEIWKESSGDGPLPMRLIQESELPEVYKKEYETRPGDSTEYGRGQRQRKEVYYTDGLTDEQFINIIDMDEEEFNRIIAEKQKLLLKNRENSRKRVFQQSKGEDSQATESVAETSSISSSIRTSKRVAKLKAENDADIDTDPMATPSMSIKLSRRKGKGKIVEQLNPEENDQTPDTFSSSRPKRKIKRFKIFEDDDDMFNKDLFEDSVSLMSIKGKKRKHNIDDNKRRLKLTDSNEKFMRMKPIFQECISHIENVKDENSRVRAEIFFDLPSKKEYPEYYRIIKKPIAINTIRSRIEKNKYKTLGQFRDDVLLMFQNARIFNEDDSEVFKDSQVLEREFSNRFRELTRETEELLNFDNVEPMEVDDFLV